MLTKVIICHFCLHADHSMQQLACSLHLHSKSTTCDRQIGQTIYNSSAMHQMQMGTGTYLPSEPHDMVCWALIGLS